MIAPRTERTREYQKASGMYRWWVAPVCWLRGHRWQRWLRGFEDWEPYRMRYCRRCCLMEVER